MAYNNKFVVCVLVNNTPVNESQNNIVPISFGTEFKLRFRNKNNRRALVKFKIDGENVSKNGYIIPANSYIDIERFAESNKKFKFVEENSPESIDFGKNKLNDGLKGKIEAIFYLEKEYNPIDTLKYYVPNKYHYIYDYYPYYPYYYGDSSYVPIKANQSGLTFTSINPKFFEGGTNFSLNSLSTNTSLQNNLENNDLKDGCVVEGNISNQNFGNSYIDIDYLCNTEIVLYLKGIQQNTYSQLQPDLRENYFCTNCGKRSSKNDNFCGKCGNSLV